MGSGFSYFQERDGVGEKDSSSSLAPSSRDVERSAKISGGRNMSADIEGENEKVEI